ncbi:MAG: hypothetical protein M3O36_13445, partial [Myxococcota bacterium]|nr:hypothetical protein [Myxococcota bacterium]
PDPEPFPLPLPEDDGAPDPASVPTLPLPQADAATTAAPKPTTPSDNAILLTRLLLRLCVTGDASSRSCAKLPM